MTNFYQTTYQNRIELKAILKKNKLAFEADNSVAKDEFLTNINNFLAKSRPSFTDLDIVYRALKTYQNQLDPKSQIALRLAVQELLLPIKAIINFALLGTFGLNYNFAYDHNYNGDYDSILKSFADSTTNQGSVTYQTLIINLLREIDSEGDPTLDKLWLDMYASGLTENAVYNKLINVYYNYASRVDQYLVTSSVYQAISDGITISDIPTTLDLLDLIGTYLQQNNIAFSTFLTNFKNNFALANNYVLSQSGVSGEGIAFSILKSIAISLEITTLDNETSTKILNNLILDIFSSSMNLENIINNLNSFASDVENVQDSKMFIANLYKCFNLGAGSSIKGAADLLKDISSSSDINYTSDILQEAKSFVDNLASSSYLSYGDLASSIALLSSSITPKTIAELELDMAGSGFPVSRLSANLNYVKIDENNYADYLTSKVDYAYIFDIYHKLVNDLYLSFNLGEYYLDLTSSITNNFEVNSQVVSDFIVSVQNIAQSEVVVDYSSLSSAVAGLFTPYNSDLAIKIENDISNVGLKIEDIKGYLARINGESASQIAASMYYAWGGAFLSASKGANALASEIDYFNTEASDIAIFFSNLKDLLYRYDQTENYALASVLVNLIRGNSDNVELINSLNQDFDASNLTSSEIINLFKSIEANYQVGESKGALITAQIYRGLHYPYESAIQGKYDLANAIFQYYGSDNFPSFTSTAGNTSIEPVDKYLNICSFSEGIYTVGHSVFIDFDHQLQGVSLLQMPELFTSSGRKSASSQCSRFINNNIGNDLYLTKTHPAGVTGSSDDTGCTDSIPASVFMAYCDSVFIDSNPI